MNSTYHFRPCPHCGALMRPGTLARHEQACIRRPDIYARLRTALTSANGALGVTYSRYLELRAADKTLPSLNTLIRQSGAAQWGSVLAFFKLSVPPQEAPPMQRQPNRAAAKRAKRPPKPVAPPPAAPPVQPAPVALAVTPAVEQVASLPLPRIAPAAPVAPASKWAGLKGYDPTWQAPTGDTLRFVRVQPGERTCLRCGETFADGDYCARCGTRADGTRRSPGDMPPSVPTAQYLRPDEYAVVR